MIPTPDRSRFFAFGRIFAGTLTAGMAVRILGPNFVPGSKADSYNGTVNRTMMMMGKKPENIQICPCGNTIALVGIERLINGLRLLTQSDACVQWITSPSNENIVCGVGELHLEICLKNLEKDFAKNEIKKNTPVVSNR
jgi:elongation factor 2